jgi:SAM-dependent methyltransferase
MSIHTVRIESSAEEYEMSVSAPISSLREATDRILEAARLEEHLLPEYPLHHLRNRVSLLNYARIAQECAQALGNRGRILDWGCGHGQNNLLLRTAGLEVVSYDIQDWGPGYRIKDVLGVQPVISDDRTLLPFDDATFDAVLSCGCLEHVEAPAGSVREIFRVLKPGGRFFIYFLPNQLSYTEALATWRGRSDHPVKYTARSLRRLMRGAPFKEAYCRYQNLFPKNLTGLPGFFRSFYDSHPTFVLGLESVLLKIPGLRMISGTFEALYSKPV